MLRQLPSRLRLGAKRNVVEDAPLGSTSPYPLAGGQYNRFKFAVGSLWRRCVDWLDWMLVEAWNLEHNQLHHYYLGETRDPDLVEVNLRMIRDLKAHRQRLGYGGVGSMGVG